MIGNLLALKPNKVSVNLTQYSTVWMGDTGVGKTTTFMKFLKELVPDKDPLFLEFEDRFQNIPGIMAVKIDTMADLKSVIGQLRNPEFKKRFSCIVIDTLDKFEESCERYVLENRDAEILKDVGAFGEGSLRFKSALRNIGIIQSLGYTVHFIAQSTHSKDFDTKKESDTLKLNKNTFSYCREAAYLVGYMYREKDERFITFKKTDKYPDLKDTFNLPDKINVKDLKTTWIKAVEDLGGDFTTKEKTIDKAMPVEDFDAIKARGVELGGILASNGHLAEATAVLQRNLGLDDNGHVKMFDTLRDTQLDLTKVIVMELEDLIKKYEIKA